MSATCPACGVAVVPGYVRCPKCQRPLPAAPRRLATTVAGGTAVASRGNLPMLPIALGAVAVAVILLVVVMRDDDRPAAAPAAGEVDDDRDDATAERPGTPRLNPVPALPDDDEPGGNRIDPNALARDLERVLDQRRLWSTVEVVGGRVEVRSGACRDENMLPIVDAARSALRNAGLTRLTCVENSGAVVFEREL